MKQLSGETSSTARSDIRRLLATGLCFAAFALGCILFTLCVLPVAALRPGGTARIRRHRVRRAIARALRGFAGLMRATGVLSYELSGAERLGRPGQLIVANHPTLIDAIFLVGYVAGSNCIVKQALRGNPLTAWPVRAAGYVSNSPTEAMIESASEALRSGQSVIIFPEGTRTAPGQPMQFHRGAAAIAMRAAAVVTPVFIRCTPPTLAKREPWYRIPERPVHILIWVGADIDPEPFRQAAPGPIAARQFNEFVLRVYERELMPAGESD